MNKITPKIIFNRIASRLKKKYNELSYIIYAEYGFEKWFQWECYLSMKNDVAPIAYDEKWKKMYLDEKKEERIADIGLEYTVEEKKNNKKFRPDLYIAETPFVLKRVDKNWKVLSENKQKDLESIFKSNEVKYHYIELKCEWVDFKKDLILGKFEQDMHKINTHKFCKTYTPKTYIAISLITFYSKKDKKFKKSDMNSVLKNYSKPNIRSGWDAGSFLHKHVGGNTFLVGVYKTLN